VPTSNLTHRAKHLAEIHGAPKHSWGALVGRMLDGAGWNVEQTQAAIKIVLAVKSPRGYEKLFPLEKLQLLAAEGNDLKETVDLGVRAIERARADIRDVQFAVDEYLAKFETWLTERGGWDHRAIASKAQALTDQQRALREASRRRPLSQSGRSRSRNGRP